MKKETVANPKDGNPPLRRPDSTAAGREHKQRNCPAASRNYSQPSLSTGWRAFPCLVQNFFTQLPFLQLYMTCAGIIMSTKLRPVLFSRFSAARSCLQGFGRKQGDWVFFEVR